MDITVDGIIYESQLHGGVSHLYDEILPRMCDQDDSLRVRVLTSGACRRGPPVHPHISWRMLFPVDDLFRPRRFWRSSRFQIRAYLQHFAYEGGVGDVWHSTNYTIPYSWRGPVVLTVYDLIYERFSSDILSEPIYESIREHRRRCVARADLLICISETTRKDLEKYFGVDIAKTRVVHLAASSVFRHAADPGHLACSVSSKPFLLYVGGRQSYKNFGNLVVAYALWPGREGTDLVVVGDPWSKAERKTLKELGLDQQVHLLTSVDDEKLCILYNCASAYILPALWEGFGIPLLEAMGCGCPIVASRIASTMEIAEDCPVYFEPTDTESLISALNNVMAEGRDSARIGRGLNRAAQFSWDIAAHETLNVYREAVTKRLNSDNLDVV